MKANRKILYITATLSLLVILLTQCMQSSVHFNDGRGKAYAGAESCKQCHQSIYDAVAASAHFNATSPASTKTIHGDFTQGQNIFQYNDSTKVVMEKRDSGMYQVLYVKNKEVKAFRFDITFGWQHAQTWLYWNEDRTFELPVSYYTSIHGWATSPGYSSAQPDFRRFIGKDCFECHSANVNTKLNASTSGITEVMEKTSIQYGIDCERCHGPAANHVNYHLQNPGEKTGKYIAVYNTLSRQQQLDACALCHSGNDKLKIESRFKFKMGDSLSNFFMPNEGHKANNDFDVHGNQYRLLSESKCFLNSNNMTCSTCHDPHSNASKDVSFYSQKCMSCHSEANHNFCTVTTQSISSLKDNCIDCHMPAKPSEAISFKLPGSDQPSSYLLRTHRIGIYPADTKNINVAKGDKK